MAPFMSISGLGGANPSFAKGGVSYVTANLILFLDAGDSSSYSGSGTTWTDISGQSNNATLVNGVGYSSDDGGALTFDGSNVIHAGSDGRRYSFAGGGSSHYMKFDSTLNGIILNGYGGIAFETNGTNERLRIDSTGRLLLGSGATATPKIISDIEKTLNLKNPNLIK